MPGLTHIDGEGRAIMVDVNGKTPQRRTARASGRIALASETIALIRENSIKKGDVLAVAEIAGIQAAKQCATLIPLCHPLQLGKVTVQARIQEEGVALMAEVCCVVVSGFRVSKFD